jgi:hypothetical protein
MEIPRYMPKRGLALFSAAAPAGADLMMIQNFQ